jgi:hypothetical protein
MAIQKISTTALADNAVTNIKISDGQVTTNDLAANAVTTEKLNSAGIAPTISGGSINNTTVGQVTAAAVAATTLTASGNATITGTISSTTGGIQNTIIGSTTPAAGTFTDLAATTFSLSGDTVQMSEGGLGANVSAYNGLVRINAGTASAVALPLPAANGGLGVNAATFNGLVKLDGAGNGSVVALPLTIANGGTGAGTQASAINALLPTQTGNSGKVLSTTGSDVQWVPSGVSSWSVITANPNPAVAGTNYMCNTTSAGFTVNLPASPTVGDTIRIADYAGTFATNTLTVGRNTKNIMGSATDMTISTNNVSITLVYIDVTQGWRIV